MFASISLPVVYGGQEGKGEVVLGFHYAHGELQDWLGFDILAVPREVTGFEPGIHPVCVENEKGERRGATLFVWDTPIGKKGLCVLPTDMLSCEYAARKYVEKPIML